MDNTEKATIQRLAECFEDLADAMQDMKDLVSGIAYELNALSEDDEQDIFAEDSNEIRCD